MPVSHQRSDTKKVQNIDAIRTRSLLGGLRHNRAFFLQSRKCAPESQRHLKKKGARAKKNIDVVGMTQRASNHGLLVC